MCSVVLQSVLVFLFFIGFFFFSSRRRHTRLVSDWSSDVCSSDLAEAVGFVPGCKSPQQRVSLFGDARGERSEERRVGKSVDLGGRRIIKKKKTKRQNHKWSRQYRQ